MGLSSRSFTTPLIPRCTCRVNTIPTVKLGPAHSHGETCHSPGRWTAQGSWYAGS
ncbi:hypothetical protein COCON_G00160150 [Conger conger]|uniref:Uncharacterized protein n=1 Tax=Conger conger TaxID=82655 RepID=A0A9Q1HVI4_CONCO|nr:hypothetical protein COCON_G00160150 [Conger conger]